MWGNVQMAEFQTTITAVAVYPDRARVSRSGTLKLEPGSHRIEIAELPRNLDRASVRAAARGTARARLLGVDVQRRFYTETPAERVRELEQQVEALSDEIRALDAQVELLKGEQTAVIDLAAQTRAFARGLAYGRTTPEAQMALLDSVRSRAEALNKVLLGLAVQRRDLERRLQKAQKELDQLRAARGRERYTAVVEVEVTQAGDLTVELTYVVSDAGWKPLYDLRLLEGGEKPISPYALLPGPANLFTGDEFIGATKLELIPPQGEIELYLGVDDHIKIERELKRREVDRKLIGDRRRLQYGYEITLENHLAVEAHITLHDQIPVSRHEAIKVRLESADPRLSAQTELNLLDWELVLKPGEKRTVRFDFSIEHPREMELVGLP